VPTFAINYIAVKQTFYIRGMSQQFVTEKCQSVNMLRWLAECNILRMRLTQESWWAWSALFCSCCTTAIQQRYPDCFSLMTRRGTSTRHDNSTTIVPDLSKSTP